MRYPATTPIANVSGGKDSAAMCLYLQEQGIEHRRVFAATGWEHPDTYRYIRDELQEKLGPIDCVRGNYTFQSLCKKRGMFPGPGAKFCTQELKSRPLAAYMRQFAGEVICCVGIRAAESRNRANLPEREEAVPLFGDRADRKSVTLWRPLIAWSEQDVIDIHRRHGLKPNPLYLRGMTRVGCWPCIHANKRDLRIVSELTPDRIDTIRQLEAEVQVAAKERAEAAGRKPKLPTMFYHGKLGAVGIDRMIEWANSPRRTVNPLDDPLAYYDEPEEEPGCMKWGMCSA